MYFAVKRTLRIGNKRYVPCVCYKLNDNLKEVVSELIEKDWAYTSDTYMVFESAVRVDKAAVAAREKAAKAEAKAAKKSGF